MGTGCDTQSDWTSRGWRSRLGPLCGEGWPHQLQSPIRSFLKFCNQLNIAPLPAQEWTLIIYTAHLAQTVSVSTIKMHMAAIRHLHIIQGLDPPPTTSPRIHLVISGIQRVRPRGSQSRLPVTPTILHRGKDVLDQDPLGFNNRLL